MNKFKVLLLTGIVAAVSATATPILVSLSLTGGVDSTTVGPAFPDQSIDFLGLVTVSGCSDITYCGAIGSTVAVTANPFLGTVGSPFTFTFNGGTLVYTTDSTWSLTGGPSYPILTSGTYTSNIVGADATPGTLNLTFVDFPSLGRYDLSGQGNSSPVPEPTSMALLGGGLLGLGYLARRRRK